MGRRTRALAGLLGGLALSATGCGGGNGAPPNCGTTQPCGGDVVGMWHFAGTCSNLKGTSAEVAAACPGASVTANNVSLTGSLTFNADQTYTATNWHETFSGVENIPLSCLAASATVCADLNGTESDSTNGKTVTTTTTCTGTATCSCRIVGTVTLASDAGNYYVAGTTLQMIGGSTSADFAYCVEETRLHLLQLSTTMTTPLGQAVILADVVLER
jgi:hypothetical protein